MLPADFLKTFWRSPAAVGGSQDRLIREGSGSAFPKRRQSLVQTVISEEAEDEQGTRQLPSFVSTFRRFHIFDACQYSQRLDVAFCRNLFQPYMKREQSHFNFQELIPFRWIKKKNCFFHMMKSPISFFTDMLYCRFRRRSGCDSVIVPQKKRKRKGETIADRGMKYLPGGAGKRETGKCYIFSGRSI